jgi:hypothetical protein
MYSVIVHQGLDGCFGRKNPITWVVSLLMRLEDLYD